MKSQVWYSEDFDTQAIIYSDNSVELYLQNYGYWLYYAPTDVEGKATDLLKANGFEKVADLQ